MEQRSAGEARIRPVSHRSDSQCVALSTRPTEAEYMALPLGKLGLASAAHEAIWLQHLVGDLRNNSVDPMDLNEDLLLLA